MRLTGDERSMGCGSGPCTSGFSRSAQTFAELAQREAGCGAYSMWMSIAGISSGNVCVVKVIDGSTPKIQKACASGHKLSKVVIHVISIIDGQSKVTLEYELQDAIVSQYAICSRASSNSESPTDWQEDGTPRERVCFSFATISWTHHKMDALGNSPGKIQESYTVGSS